MFLTLKKYFVKSFYFVVILKSEDIAAYERGKMNKIFEDFKMKSNEYATLQDFVMYLLGNNIVELDYENPFYKEGNK